MVKAQLNSKFIASGSGEYDRIEAASNVVSEKLTQATEDRGYRLWWSWGDSRSWRVIIGIPTEEGVADLLGNRSRLNGFAHELIDMIGSVVALEADFKLYLELDSDERVDANEGWFFRIKSEPRPSRERQFIRNDKRFSRA
jgi:hypothetical protein